MTHKNHNFITFTFAFFFLLHGISYSNALGDTAAGMQPGQWKELVTKNLSNDTLLYMNVNSELWYADMSTTWTNYLSWNPATQELFWTGAPHLVPYAFLRYSAAQNRWYNDTSVPDCMRLGGYSGCFSHGYHAGTIDAEKGIFYFVTGTQIFAFDIAAKRWSGWNQSDLSTGPGQSLEYFPPLGKLAYLIGTTVGDGGMVQLIDPSAHKREIAAQRLDMGSYHNTMTYSSPHRKLYFGGGNDSRAFYSMDSAKNVVRLADAPETITCIGSSLATDPVTGNPLFLANSNNYYVFDAAANKWAHITNPPAQLINPAMNSVSALATSIPEYGVVFYLSPNLKKVYLYKYANTASHSATPVTHVSKFYGQLKVDVYDIRGRRIGVFGSGMVRTSGSPEGVYLIKTGSSTYHSVKKVTVLR